MVSFFCIWVYFLKAEPKRGRKLAWKGRKHVIISISGLRLVALSILLREKHAFFFRFVQRWFALHRWRAEKGWVVTYCVWYFRHLFRLCSWRHWYRLLGTKWQRLRSCFLRLSNVDFFNIQNLKSNDILLWLLLIDLSVFSPFLLMQPAFVCCCFYSILRDTSKAESC